MSRDVSIKTDEIVELSFIHFVGRNGDLTLKFVCSRIHDLKSIELLLDQFLEVLPLALVLLIILIFGLELNYTRIFKVLLQKHDPALLIPHNRCGLLDSCL